MDEKASSSGTGGQKAAPSPVRLEDVAAAAGVSTITVSRCMTNPDRVSARTREHVLKVAASLGYIPNRLASSLASARSMVVGIIVPTIANPIHGVIMQRASGEIRLERTQQGVATLEQPGQPTHDISLPRRSLRDCLAEELRRLDPDDLFGEVVQKGLALLETPVARAETERK